MSKCEISFKVGDKVRLVKSTYPDGDAGAVFDNYKQGDELLVTDNISQGYWDDGSGLFEVGRGEYIVTGSMLELVEDVVPTPKSMLKNFIRAVTGEGSIYITIGNMLVDQNNMYILQDNLDNNLENEFKELSVDSLYWCEEDNLLIDFSYQGTLIWQRESAEDVAKKNKRFDLTAIMNKLQADLDEVKKQLEEMK